MALKPSNIHCKNTLSINTAAVTTGTVLGASQSSQGASTEHLLGCWWTLGGPLLQYELEED